MSFKERLEGEDPVNLWGTGEEPTESRQASAGAPAVERTLGRRNRWEGRNSGHRADLTGSVKNLRLCLLK